MIELKKAYDEKLSMKEELRKKSEHMELMLDRASQLVSGLTGEKARWELTVTVSYFERHRLFRVISLCILQHVACDVCIESKFWFGFV